MVGQTDDTPGLEHHKFMPGNKPSSVLMIDALTPETLGALMALYEHKVYVQSVIWNVNAFDQWGVELGKDISNAINGEIDAHKSYEDMLNDGLDPSTATLIARYQAQS